MKIYRFQKFSRYKLCICIGEAFMFARVLKAANHTYPLNAYNSVWLRLRFIKHALVHHNVLRSFISNIESLHYSSLFDHKIPVLGAVEWPYIHKDWPVEKRFSVIQQHYEIIKDLPEILNVADGHPKVLVNLHGYSANTTIVLDKAQWFVREGEIVLNIFKEQFRVMSIAFTLARENDELLMYVGAVQGLHADEHSLEKFKALTKDLEGVRPRDFLMEVLRMIAQSIGVSKILGISDSFRHHRHPYFANYHSNTLKTNYDDIWLEQGGVTYSNDYYMIPLNKPRKNLADISSNKRAMYRRRYELFDDIHQKIDLVIGKNEKKYEVVLEPKAVVVENNVLEAA